MMRSAGTYRVRSSGRPLVRGMGQASSVPSMQKSGFFTVDCSSPVSWAFNPVCWDYAPSAWAQMNAIATAAGPIPEPAPPTGPSTLQQETIPGAFTPEQGISGGVAATQQQLQDYFGGVATSLQNMPAAATGAPGLSTTGIAAIALGGAALLLILAGGRRGRR